MEEEQILYSKYADALRKAQADNRLVIFAGSGISANSGLPTWGKLIRQFAQTLPHKKCINCELKGTNCAEADNTICSLANEEFLKIPQYWFNTYGKKKYEQFIKNAFKKSKEASSLHRLIFSIEPRHIITTNFDNLLEDTKHKNRHYYSVVIKDNDFLKAQTKSYILKIHGDIEDPQSIVLKEEDFLNYNHQHIMLETYLKSLLIDHTFIFIGYSLNDYNVKQTISWLNYLGKEIKNSIPRHFILKTQTQKIEPYERTYFRKNNMAILNYYDFPEQIRNTFKNQPTDLKGEGVELYNLLIHIFDIP